MHTSMHILVWYGLVQKPIEILHYIYAEGESLSVPPSAVAMTDTLGVLQLTGCNQITVKTNPILQISDTQAKINQH